MKNKTRFYFRLGVVAASLIAAGVVGLTLYLTTPKLRRGGAIDALLPSVVRITTHAFTQEKASPENAMTASSPLETDKNSEKSEAPAARIKESFGSGFVIDKKGYIVTNRHVVKDAYEVIVTLNDGALYHAEVVGHGGDVDLALLKIAPKQKLKPATFGDSNEIHIGDNVYVIGNPFGLGVSVTSGIISALNRDLGMSMIDSFIQTDASINHGNSGGPLFDINGRVIGVNTAYYNGGAAGGGSIGLGFAIPSETTQEIVGQLRDYGYLRFGWIGVDGATLTPEMANALGLAPGTTGAVVASVHPSAPATGLLRQGDIILEVNKAKLADMRQLRRDVAQAIGETLTLKILRAGQARQINVMIAEMPGMKPVGARAPAHEARLGAMALDLGFDVAPIQAVERGDYHMDAQEQGVMVTQVRSNSAAAQSGLQIGDRIVTLQLARIDEPADVQKIIAAVQAEKRDYLLALIHTQANKPRYLSLPLRSTSAPSDQ